MLGNIAPTVRRSAAVTTVVAIVTVVMCAVFAGHKGLIGAAIAVAVVAAFFGLSALALGLASRVSTQAMMLAGIGTYTFKILVLIALVSRFQDSKAFSAWAFGLSAIVLVLVYDATLAVTWSRTKMLYVEPERER